VYRRPTPHTSAFAPASLPVSTFGPAPSSRGLAATRDGACNRTYEPPDVLGEREGEGEGSGEGKRRELGSRREKGKEKPRAMADEFSFLNFGWGGGTPAVRDW